MQKLLARETNAKIYRLNDCMSGDNDKKLIYKMQ